jgi:hypothetical protein
MNLFFGRNVEAETREVTLFGRVEINNKPMRTKVYTLLDEINQHRNKLMKLPKEYRNNLLDSLNKVKDAVNNL